MKPKKPIITPFLIVQNATNALDFYKAAFGAEVLNKFDMPDGKVTSKIGIEGAELFVGDEEPEFANFSPTTIGGSAVRIILTVENPDAVFTRAVKAGATQICPVTTEDSWRIGKLKDPFGHTWEIGHPLAEKSAPSGI